MAKYGVNYQGQRGGKGGRKTKIARNNRKKLNQSEEKTHDSETDTPTPSEIEQPIQITETKQTPSIEIAKVETSSLVENATPSSLGEGNWYDNLNEGEGEQKIESEGNWFDNLNEENEGNWHDTLENNEDEKKNEGEGNWYDQLVEEGEQKIEENEGEGNWYDNVDEAEQKIEEDFIEGEIPNELIDEDINVEGTQVKLSKQEIQRLREEKKKEQKGGGG